MKKTILSIIVLMSLTFFVATPALAETKIAVINMQDLLQKIPQMKKIGDDLKKQFGDKQKQLVSAQETFKKNVDKFKKDSAVISDKDKQAAEDKLFKEQQDLQTMQTDFQHDYMTAQNKQVDTLMTSIKKVVEKIATQDHFDLVLINTSVAYARKDMDITAQILKEMDSQ